MVFLVALELNHRVCATALLQSAQHLAGLGPFELNLLKCQLPIFSF